MNKNLELLKSKLTPEEFELFEKNFKTSRTDTTGYTIEQYCLDEPQYSVKELISGAFQWDKSDQGKAYWKEVSLR